MRSRNEAMRAEGLEPPRSCEHEDLNLARLPIPPRPHWRPVAPDCTVDGMTTGEQWSEDDIVVEHPNREKAASKATRVIVVVLMVASALVMAVVQIGGWEVSSGMAMLSFALVAIYLVLAFYIARWSKGMLPVAAGASAIVLANALVAIPSWSNRHAVGFTIDTMDPAVLAALCAILVPLQILLAFFALRGFRQDWNVEVERLPDGTTRKAVRFRD